jgi:hypothetical protein
MRAIPFLILAYLLYYGLLGISMEPGPPVGADYLSWRLFL